MPAPLYKVILVDDEEAVRRAVIRRLDWEALGFCVVGEAANGQEALELAERLKPDVVMTDIRMPFMDGLELCRQLKRLLPATRIAILTGFDEFEYAREAITQQVEDYILKPVDAGELAAIFTRIRQSLDAEIARHRDIERLRRLYAQSLPVLQKQALLEWLTGGMTAPDIPAALLECGLDIAAGAYCAASLRFESDETDAHGLLASSLSELTDNTLPDAPAHFVLQPPGRIAVIFLLPPGAGPQAAADALQPLFALAQKLLGARLHIGLGKAYTRPEDLARSYAEADGALAYQFLLEPGQCVFIGDIEPGSGEEERLPDPAFADALFRQIKTGSSEDLASAVDSLVAHLKSTGASPQQYQIFLLELFTGLLKIIRTYQMDEKESRRDVLLSEGLTLRLSSLSELRAFLLDFATGCAASRARGARTPCAC